MQNDVVHEMDDTNSSTAPPRSRNIGVSLFGIGGKKTKDWDVDGDEPNPRQLGNGPTSAGL